MRVTAIEPRRKGLSALCLDEEKVLVDTETLLSFGIQPGDELEQGRLDELVSASDRRRARERALYILTYRDHSREELRRKLLAAGFLPDAVEAAVQKMCELGLIDDGEYAESSRASCCSAKS